MIFANPGFNLIQKNKINNCMSFIDHLLGLLENIWAWLLTYITPKSDPPTCDDVNNTLHFGPLYGAALAMINFYCTNNDLRNFFYIFT